MKKSDMRPHLREDSVMALIEIPRGSRNKYEWDEDMEGVALSRVLYQSVAYPTEYGFIPGTRAGDGDALDVVVLIDQPTFPGCLMRVRPIGLLRLVQEGQQDDKVLCVPVADPLYTETRDIGDIPPHRLVEIRHFFATYTELEGREVEVGEWEGARAAMEEIRACLLPECREVETPGNSAVLAT
ncbi:MAG: inorganic diphosphatase [Armatimonadetes bacterium]|nr:inorganic diphosphatase [Armatimonadota bacterium]